MVYCIPDLNNLPLLSWCSVTSTTILSSCIWLFTSSLKCYISFKLYVTNTIALHWDSKYSILDKWIKATEIVTGQKFRHPMSKFMFLSMAKWINDDMIFKRHNVEDNSNNILILFYDYVFISIVYSFQITKMKRARSKFVDRAVFSNSPCGNYQNF